MQAAAFTERLDRGHLLLDAGLGSELQARGVPTPAPLWSGWAVAHAPEAILAIHRAHVKAGAQISILGSSAIQASLASWLSIVQMAKVRFVRVCNALFWNLLLGFRKQRNEK